MAKAMRAADVEIEESLEDEKAKLEEQAKKRLRDRKADLEKRLANCKDRAERRDLMKQIEDADRQFEKKLDKERMKQDRLLEEKRKARMAKRKIRELEVSKRQAKELVDKECEDDRRDMQDRLTQLDDRVKSGLGAQLDEVTRRRGPRGRKEQGLVLVKETIEEVHDKKMSLLRKRQFTELQRRLGNVVQGAGVARVIGRM
jgi:hypothetical protein